MNKGNLGQVGYVVRPGGLDAAIDHWVRVMGAGPFFKLPAQLQNAVFHGQPIDHQIEAAIGYHGDVQIELVSPVEGATGAFTSFLEEHPNLPVGGLFHHVVVDDGDFDATVARLTAGGAKLAFSVDMVGSGNVVYLEAFDTVGGYIEVINAPMWPLMCAAMRQTRAEWDGQQATGTLEQLWGTMQSLSSAS